jgi:hypothetical protein
LDVDVFHVQDETSTGNRPLDASEVKCEETLSHKVSIG